VNFILSREPLGDFMLRFLTKFTPSFLVSSSTSEMEPSHSDSGMDTMSDRDSLEHHSSARVSETPSTSSLCENDIPSIEIIPHNLAKNSSMPNEVTAQNLGRIKRPHSETDNQVPKR
jgi:hypothetical protein